MSRLKRTALAFAYFWPWIAILLTLAYVAANIIVAVQTGRDEGLGWNIPGRYFLALYLVTMLDIAGTLVHAIANLFRTEAIPESQKSLWAVILLLASVFTLPVYWYMHIRRAGGPVRSVTDQT